jgi:crotonobetaine/carnitine-CoA ligase
MIRLAPDERTLPALLRRAGDTYGPRPCLTVGNVRLRYEDVPEAAARHAGTLAAAGVRPGDRVAVIAENRWELLALWLGCAWLNAILVPVNTASRGAQLDHVLGNAGPRVLALEPERLAHLDALQAPPPELERLWALDACEAPSWHGLPVEAFPGAGDAVAATPVDPADTLAILYTSGTTGPSKGVMCPHAQFTWWGEIVGGWLGLGPEDVTYTCLPLFHTNALNAFVQAMMHGSHFVAGPRFSASQLWERLVAADATVTYLLGAMVSILASREPSPLDRAHRVRVALAPATPPGLWDVFRERFGIEIVDGHGMTETNATIGPRDGEQRPGTMGRVGPGFAARVVDESGNVVPDGVAGELLVRADERLAFATGYWRMPEATEAGWRDGWFHTGDRVVREPDGYYRFLDRSKDAIRRRGENVSAWEVEQTLLQHPSVAAAAAIPVPSALGEDDVMACVVARDGMTVDPVDLIRFCEPRLAYFAIPRYVDVLDALPLTENGKVRKFVLRERGVTSTTWDREAAGLVLRR